MDVWVIMIGYPSRRSPLPGRMAWRSPQIRTRTATVQPQHLPPCLNLGLRCVVPPYPARRPCMPFLSVGSQSCPSSFALAGYGGLAGFLPTVGRPSASRLSLPGFPSCLRLVLCLCSPHRQVHIQGTGYPISSRPCWAYAKLCTVQGARALRGYLAGESTTLCRT